MAWMNEFCIQTYNYYHGHTWFCPILIGHFRGASDIFFHFVASHHAVVAFLVLGATPVLLFSHDFGVQFPSVPLSTRPHGSVRLKHWITVMLVKRRPTTTPLRGTRHMLYLSHRWRWLHRPVPSEMCIYNFIQLQPEKRQQSLGELHTGFFLHGYWKMMVTLVISKWYFISFSNCVDFIL